MSPQKTITPYLLSLITFMIFGLSRVDACSMYKITRNGKTIVGNNEDWISPNGQFWFEPGKEGEYGVMNVGFLNNFAQGAINEAGLMFDGFANPYLEINDVEGKVNMPIGQVVQKIMHTMDRVEQVKAYLSPINLSSLVTSQVVFVDQSGGYLIVEGDELIIGREAEKTFSNFYYSQINSIDEVDLPTVKNGLAYLRSSQPKRSLDYCSSVMKSFANPDGFTQYSTIYDLEKLTIRVYLYHDYSQFVEIDLQQELQKGRHRMMIAELFPKDSKGYQHYRMYNDPQDPTCFLREWIGEKKRSEEELVKNGFAFNMNIIGYEWLNDKQHPAGAIEIFKYATELMPQEVFLFEGLGEAYHSNKEYDAAIHSYRRILALEPKNGYAAEMIQKIEKDRERKK